MCSCSLTRQSRQSLTRGKEVESEPVLLSLLPLFPDLSRNRTDEFSPNYTPVATRHERTPGLLGEAEYCMHACMHCTHTHHVPVVVSGTPLSSREPSSHLTPSRHALSLLMSLTSSFRLLLLLLHHRLVLFPVNHPPSSHSPASCVSVCESGTGN